MSVKRSLTMDVVHWCKPAKMTTDQMQTLLEQEGLESELYSDRPGTKYGRHKHDFDDFVIVVSGKMKIGTDAHVWMLKAGDRIDIPANTIHWAEVVGKEEVRYLAAAK